MEEPVLGASRGVPERILHAAQASASPDLQVSICTESETYRTEPSHEWISLVASADWWRTIFAAYAAIYVAEITKEAAKETWKQRSKLSGLATRFSSIVAKTARILINAVADAPQHTALKLKATKGRHVFVLASSARTPDELTAEILLLAHFLPKIVQRYEERVEVAASEHKVIAVSFTDEGTISLRWFDKSSGGPIAVQFDPETL